MATLIADLPAHDRPRERLLARGAEALSERELLALLLGKGRRGESARDTVEWNGYFMSQSAHKVAGWLL